MENNHDDNITDLKDFKRQQKRNKKKANKLNGASAYAAKSKGPKSSLGYKVSVAIQFIFVLLITAYFFKTCGSLIPR